MKDINTYINESYKNIDIEVIKPYIEIIYNFGKKSYFKKIKDDNGTLNKEFSQIINYPKTHGALFFNLGMLDYIVYAGDTKFGGINNVCKDLVKIFNSYGCMTEEQLEKVLYDVADYLNN